MALGADYKPLIFNYSAHLLSLVKTRNLRRLSISAFGGWLGAVYVKPEKVSF